MEKQLVFILIITAVVWIFNWEIKAGLRMVFARKPKRGKTKRQFHAVIDPDILHSIVDERVELKANILHVN